MLKRTKIICTIGPASANISILRKMIRSGMNATRLNFSHGTHSEHAKLIELITMAGLKEDKNIGIIQDLQGPRIRLGVLPESGVMLKKGRMYIFTTDRRFDSRYDESNKIFVTYSNLHKDIKAGDLILIRDGLIRLRVKNVSGKDIFAKVDLGGLVGSHKGLNFPDTSLSISPITKKDLQDLEFGMQSGVDFVALSFVGSASHVHSLRRHIDGLKKKLGVVKAIGIISKIEKPEALQNIQEIINATDVVMVARGDLGVELEAYDVPVWQKRIVELCRQSAKPVIVATQMLESMIENPRPTRAEVSDIANAVIDHVDAVMLSGETANGRFPVEAVDIMNRSVLQMEASPYDDLVFKPERHYLLSDNADMIGLVSGACSRAGMIRGIILIGGDSSIIRSISSYRSEVSCFVICENSDIAKSYSLNWGVESVVIDSKDKFGKDFLKFCIRTCKVFKRGDRVLVVYCDVGKADSWNISIVSL